MKIWRFYIKPKLEGVCYPDFTHWADTTEPQLYAITNIKKYAKEFMKTRNMDLFLMKVSSEDPATWSTLANNNLDLVLEKNTFITRKDSENGLVNSISVPVLTTNSEYRQSTEDSLETININDPNLYNAIGDYNIFKNKIIDALGYIAFINFYRLNYSLEFEDESLYDYSIEVSIDELAILIVLFGKLFK